MTMADAAELAPSPEATIASEAGAGLLDPAISATKQTERKRA